MFDGDYTPAIKKINVFIKIINLKLKLIQSVLEVIYLLVNDN